MKLNFGCGSEKLAGYVNIDKEPSFHPDKIIDLEALPLPFKENSIEEIRAFHCLEFMHQDRDRYFEFWKELYRICDHNARLEILSYHPASSHFRDNPETVRPVSEALVRNLVSTARNIYFDAEPPLGARLGINFKIDEVNIRWSDRWHRELKIGRRTEEEIRELADRQNDIIQTIHIVLRADKKNIPYQKNDL